MAFDDIAAYAHSPVQHMFVLAYSLLLYAILAPYVYEHVIACRVEFKIKAATFIK